MSPMCKLSLSVSIQQSVLDSVTGGTNFCKNVKKCIHWRKIKENKNVGGIKKILILVNMVALDAFITVQLDMKC